MRKKQLVSGIYNAMQSNITVWMTLMTNKAKKNMEKMCHETAKIAASCHSLNYLSTDTKYENQHATFRFYTYG